MFSNPVLIGDAILWLVVFALLVWGIIYYMRGTRTTNLDIPTPSSSAEDPSPAAYVLPVLPKGGSIIFGVGFSIFIAVVADIMLFMVFGIAAREMIDNQTIYFVAWLLSLVGGVLIGIAAYYLGKQDNTEIGFKRVLRIFGGRISESYGNAWWKILFPEGTNWSVPFFTSTSAVDMRGRPLVKKSDPKDDVIMVETQAQVTMDTGASTTPATKRFLVAIKVKVAVRVKVFDPYAYLSFEDAEGILYNFIAEKVRLFIYNNPETDIFKIPELKEALKIHLEQELDSVGKSMGIDFIKIAVTEIEPPADLLAAAVKIPIEIIERSQQSYQADTIVEITKKLKAEFPDLSPKELKNMVLQTASLATTTVTSFEGQAIPVVSPQNK